MLSELKFVSGAVGKGDSSPALSHFRIRNNRICSYNGVIALNTPIPLDIDCSPKASTFIKAIQSCEDNVTISLTKAGRLSVKSGAFKASIECLTEITETVTPTGQEFEVDGKAFLKAIKTLSPFIGTDPKRPWGTGILLDGQSAFATNNIILVEHWVGTMFPVICVIPEPAIKELLRIKKLPIKIQATGNNMTFHYEDGSWLNTALLHNEWPNVEKLLDVKSNPKPIPEKFFEGVSTIEPFSEHNQLYLRQGRIQTHFADDLGASYEIPEINEHCAFGISFLQSLESAMKTIDFSLHPKPCAFFGDMLRGVIMGTIDR